MICNALQKYWNSKDKIALLAVESRHLQIWLKLQKVTFYYWLIQHKMFYQLRSSALLEFHPPVCCEYKYNSSWQVFLSDQLCPVALIIQVLKAGNVSYRLYPLLLYSESCNRWWHTQTRMKTRELTLREKQAINMLKEKRKSIRALAKTKGMEKISVWKPPATNNYLIVWENNSSVWPTNHKRCENEP